jgi:hypothetical protein
MALLAMQGFDDFGATSQLASDQYITNSGTNNNSLQTGRIDGQCLRIDGSGAYSQNIVLEQTSNDTYYIGFAFRPEQIVATGLFMRMYNGSTIHNSLEMGAGGTIVFQRSTTTILGTTSNTFTVGAWNYIEIKCKISNTVGTVEVWINGEKGLDLTSQDTLNGTAAAAITHINLHASSIYYLEYDDIYIGDTSGSDMTDLQDDCHITMITPDADGNRNDFTRVGGGTNNWEAVDDGATPDDDTTYNHSTTATDGELYGCGAMSGSIDSILGVQVRARVRKEDAGHRLINLICRNSTTEVDGDQQGLADAYAWKSKIYENDPDGGGAWTETDVNSAEFGLEIGT